MFVLSFSSASSVVSVMLVQLVLSLLSGRLVMSVFSVSCFFYRSVLPVLSVLFGFLFRSMLISFVLSVCSVRFVCSVCSVDSVG